MKRRHDMANEELISKIMTEVKDTELRDRLLKAVVEKETLSNDEKNILTGLGLKPDAVKKTVQLSQTMNKVGSGIFFFLGLGMTLFGQPFGILFMVMSVIIYFINKKYYGNLVG